ncbi:MAG: hypothetical protein GYB31_00300 [Bacteroidetes bacterium]|nr:hypothetical protein [Bacteroidota bacterium]
MRDAMLITHFIGLAMGVGVSFAFMFLGIASSKMAPEEGEKFMANAYSISTMGHIGLGLLILSGGYLMTPYWKILGEMPLLITKLVLVLVLAALIGIMSARVRRAKNGGDLSATLKSVRPMGQISLLISLTIIVLAVSIFH